MRDEDIFSGYGVEISFLDEDGFLKVKETLSRMGVSSKQEKSLYQSCHVLHKRGRYSIFHFKEMFSLDGKYSDISEEDLLRRDTIVTLLEEWGLVKIVDTNKLEGFRPMLSLVKIIPNKSKSEWKLITKYTIGKKSYAQP